MKNFILIGLLSLGFATSALAASTASSVTCELQNFKNCSDCEKRIPASCEDHAFNGSLDATVKPQKINWTVSNPKTGVEKQVVSTNTAVTLKDLKAASSFHAIAKKLHVTLAKNEALVLNSVVIPSATALYKASTGTAIAAQMKTIAPSRGIASTGNGPTSGGVRRAQNNSSEKKSE